MIKTATGASQAKSRSTNLDQQLTNTLECFHKRHLLRRGSYYRLRAFLPTPVLALVWWFRYRHESAADIQRFLHATVTMGHLFEAMMAAMIWSIGVSQIPARKMLTLKALRSEVLSLLYVSSVCGVFLFFCVGVRGLWLDAAQIGSATFSGFALSSIGLLCCTILSSAGLLPEPGQGRKVLLIGSGPRALSLIQTARQSHGELQLVGVLDNEIMPDFALSGLQYLGSCDLLPALLKEQPVDLVLIGLPVKSMYETIQNVISECERVGVESHYPLDVFRTDRAVVEPSVLDSQLAAHDQPRLGLGRSMKYLIDFVVAMVALTFLSPVMLAIALAVRLTSKGSILFVQERYGLNRNRFPMYKFRSMVADAEQLQAQLEAQNEADGPVFKLRKDPRITKIGGFLRRTSLDELPQLFNVLRGEMSIVGPRPLPLRDVSHFDESWLLRRFSVRPGLTCLWQVKGRSDTRFDKWMQLDLEYIDNWSIGGDLKILFQTIPAVIKGSGAM